MVRNRDLDLAPDFQRNEVWKPLQKSRLIESILLQIPLPAFYFAEDPDGTMRVVDGLQRLSTIRDYCQQEARGFALNGLEYLWEAEGKRFSELAPSWRRRLYNTQIIAYVVDPQTPDPVKFDIFKRINTLGSPLNAQEIRHCMSGPAARDFLKGSAGSEKFHRATGGVLRNHVRMVDRELALRFYAFYLLDNNIEAYAKYPTLDAFLMDATREIENLSEERRHRLFGAFETAMENAYNLFGRHAFRKWPLEEEQKRSPINRRSSRVGPSSLRR